MEGRGGGNWRKVKDGESGQWGGGGSNQRAAVERAIVGMKG